MYVASKQLEWPTSRLEPRALGVRSPFRRPQPLVNSGGVIRGEMVSLADRQTTAQQAGQGFSFGRFTLLTGERRFLAGGQSVELGSRAYDVLLTLVESGGALVTKDALLTRVWANVAVEENNIQVQVSALRRVFGPERDWIVTISGRGYRFIAPVVALPGVGRVEHAVTPLRLEAGKAPRMSILVLPLVARGDDSARDWFADGITDSLTTDLARSLPGSMVVAQTTADTYRGSAADVREISRRGRCPLRA